MVKKIVWTKRANSKFNKIVEYLEQEWGPGVTKSFIRRTYDVIELISDQSHLGTLEKPDRNIRGFLLTKHNRLFYRVTETENNSIEFL